MSTPHLAPEDADKFAAQFKPAWDDEPSAEKAAAPHFSPDVTMVSAAHEAPLPATPTIDLASPPVAQAAAEPPKAAQGVVEQGPSVVLAPEPEAPKPMLKGAGMTVRLEPGMIPPPPAPAIELAPKPAPAKPASFEDDDFAPPKQKSKLPLMLGAAAAAVLVLGVGAVVMMSGGSKDSSGDGSKAAAASSDKAPPARTDLPKVDPPKDDKPIPPPPKDEPKPAAPAKADPPVAPPKADAPVAAAPPPQKPGPMPVKDPPTAAPAPKKPGKPGGIVRDTPF